MDFRNMSDAQVRQKLIDGHTAFVHQLADADSKLAEVSLSLTNRKTGKRKLALASKVNALTALYEQVTMLTAVIDFIETMGVLEDKIDTRFRIKDELFRRHAQLVLNINREIPDLTSEVTDIAQLIARAIEQREIVHIGEKFRSRLGSTHARLMKDLAIIGYIQQFGISFRQAARRS